MKNNTSKLIDNVIATLPFCSYLLAVEIPTPSYNTYSLSSLYLVAGLTLKSLSLEKSQTMKYGDLIQFEPINEVVKFSRTNEIEYQKNLIKTFVFSKTLKESLIPLMVRNLNYLQTGETFGLS